MPTGSGCPAASSDLPETAAANLVEACPLVLLGGVEVLVPAFVAELAGLLPVGVVKETNQLFWDVLLLRSVSFDGLWLLPTVLELWPLNRRCFFGLGQARKINIDCCFHRGHLLANEVVDGSRAAHVTNMLDKHAFILHRDSC